MSVNTRTIPPTPAISTSFSCQFNRVEEFTLDSNPLYTNLKSKST